MDIRALSRLILVLFLGGFCHSAYTQDSCCAVGGAVKVEVWDKANKKRVEQSPKGVKIKVTKHPDITFTVNNEEGVYVLHMPSDKVKQFELIFELDGFPDEHDSSTNKERHNKRPMKTLFSKDAIAQGESKQEVQARAFGYLTTRIRATVEGDSELAASMARNLEMLKSSGRELGVAAAESSARGETAKADFLFERALIFQELLEPESSGVALAYENYAKFLRQQKTSVATEKAEAFSQRASQIRTGRWNFDAFVRPYGEFTHNFSSDWTQPKLGTVHIPSSERVTFRVPVTDKALSVAVIGADGDRCSLNVVNKPSAGMKPQFPFTLYGGEGVNQVIETPGVYILEIINRRNTPSTCLVRVQ